MNKTAIFIDAGHYKYRLNKIWRIDYKKFINYFKNLGMDIRYVFYYEGMPTYLSFLHQNPGASEEEYWEAKNKKKGYFRKLHSFGIIVKYKPVHRIFDKESRGYKFKCNSDVEITIDVLEKLFVDEIDIFIIGSGDGDFVNLVKYLKRHQKRVVVVGMRGYTNNDLMKSAHEVIFLDKIKDEIKFV